MTETRDTGAPAVPAPEVLWRYAREALAEDLGPGDVTTRLVVPETARARAVLVARREGVVCGLALARVVFLSLDDTLEVTPHVADGAAVAAGARLMTVEGAARPILSAERVALNFVGRLSGIASLTRRYVDAVAGTRARIMDTRKTTPGLRALERWAVASGGGTNHRFGLADGFMLKDNHRAALEAGGRDLATAVRDARERLAGGIPIVVEVDSADQIPAALAGGADVVLLDNMTPTALADAVERIGGRALAEASGGIDLNTVRAVAESGVDRISVGALTHSAPALDVALDFEWALAPAGAAAGVRES